MLQVGESLSLGSKAMVRVTLRKAGLPVSGVLFTDVQVLLLKQDDVSPTPVNITSAMWKEVAPPSAEPYYLLELQETWSDTPGSLLVYLFESPTPSVSFDPAASLSYVSDGTAREAGFLQGRNSWVPMFLTNAGLPVGGISPTVSVASDEDVSFTTLVTSPSNFREVLYLGNPTGVYQVLPGLGYFSKVGFLTVDAVDGAIDRFVLSYPVVEASLRLFEVFVLENEVGVDGVTVIASRSDTAEIVQKRQTDVAGQCSFYLPEGEYVFTKVRGAEVFDQNNHIATVFNPNTTYLDAEPAYLLSGNPGPYAFVEGDSLSIQVSGGEEQEVILTQDAVPPGYVLTSLPAHILASMLSRMFHSMRFFSGGAGGRYLSVQTIRKGAVASIQVLGGTANLLLNLSLVEVFGRDAQPAGNRLYLSGSRYQYTTPPDPLDLVKMNYRAVDISGSPVRGQVVRITNKMSPAIRTLDGSSVTGGRVLDCITDADGVCRVRSGPRQGEIPLLIKGSKVDIAVHGSGIARFDVTVPQTDFQLMDLISQSVNDLLQLQKILLPLAPRS